MKRRYPSFLFFVSTFAVVAMALLIFTSGNSVSSQTPNKNFNTNRGRPSRTAIHLPTPTPTPESSDEPQDIVRVDTDLVKVDALVMQKNTARIVGGLNKEDFLLYEDGTKQEITHFSTDSLPLSVILVIDRGSQCPFESVDPYVDEVRRAAREAIERLKPVDEIAVMSFDNSTTLEQPFTSNRIMLENALNNVKGRDKVLLHCLNHVLSDAAHYMIKASNPAGRRVIIVISAVTRSEACYNGPSAKSAAQSIYESGSVVCGIISKVKGQAVENAVASVTTRMTKLTADYVDLQTLANETGGEVLSDKLANLDLTFQTLIDHLRNRYNLAFVSTNKTRDGAMRKLKLDLTPTIQKSKGKMVIRARRSYIAPRS
jgi:VWFA-related protein